MELSRGVSPSVSRRWRFITYALIAVILLLHVSILVTKSWQTTPEVPIRDEWALVTLMQKRDSGDLGLDDFLAFHNEHRIVLSRLIGLAVVDTTGWNRQSHLLVAFAIVGITCLSLFLAIRATIRSALGTAVLAVPLALLLFSHARWENWLIPFTDKIPTALGVALCCFAFAKQPLGRWWFGSALAGAAVASLSSFGGLVVWPAFLPAAIWAGRRFAISWGAIGVTTIGAYLIDFPRRDTSMTLDIEQMTAFVLTYLGAPVSGPDVPAAQVATVVCLLVVGLNVIACWRLQVVHRDDLGLLMPWLGLGLFAVGTSLLGSVTRVPAAGLYSRYHALALFWWIACLVVLYLSTVRIVASWPQAASTAQSGFRRTTALVNGIAAMVLLVSIAGANIEGSRRGTVVRARYLEAEPCFRVYERAPNECLEIYYARASWLPRSPDYLSQRGLALFRQSASIDPARLPARPSDDTGAVTRFGSRRLGVHREEVIRTIADAPVTLAGWGFDPSLGQPASGVLVTIDDREPFWSPIYRQRQAIARKRGDPVYLHTGYKVVLPADAMTPGEHTVTVQVIGADAQYIYEPNPKSEVIRVQVLPGNSE